MDSSVSFGQASEREVIFARMEKREASPTVAEKLEILDRIRGGEKIRHMCKEHDISTSTLCGWLKDAEGHWKTEWENKKYNLRGSITKEAESDTENENPTPSISSASSESNAEDKRKHSRAAFSLNDKLYILNQLDKGATPTNLSRQFGYNVQTIYGWKRNAQEIRRQVNDGVQPDRKRNRKCKFPEIEKPLLVWLEQMRTLDMAVSHDMLREAATE